MLYSLCKLTENNAAAACPVRTIKPHPIVLALRMNTCNSTAATQIQPYGNKRPVVESQKTCTFTAADEQEI